MERDQHPAKHAAPEIQGDGNGCHQNGDPRRLLQFDRDFKDVIECDGKDHARGDYGQTYPEPDPERSGDYPAGFLMIFLRGPLETKRVTAPRSPRSSRFM